MKHDLANILIKHKNPQRLAAHARRLQKLSVSQSLSQTKRARSLATRSEIMALAAAAWKADIY
ncbi:MAG: hypothetical protein K8F91_17085, partial [Candidatus Obscuribacterales bacterium]|nr:hypothetical protein [Candidatus Obscuribacterales bacterium]